MGEKYSITLYQPWYINHVGIQNYRYLQEKYIYLIKKPLKNMDF